MPLQSGSDKILAAMRRSYRSEKFLGILDKVRARIPDAAITTDIIVGFPGETEEDFQATLDVVAKARFASAYTFQYSPRPGTPAAELPDPVPQAVVTERFNRLIALQESISAEEARKLVGKVVEVLVATGEGSKDSTTNRMSGRARDGRLVHFSLPADSAADMVPRPGDLVRVEVTASAPHHLIAESALNGGLFELTRTRSGDAFENRAKPPRRLPQ
jgi:tRNA-2-methylthio-N6-dimethylallyladenosine synthase